MFRIIGRSIRNLFSKKSEELVTTEDLQRDAQLLLHEDQELSKLVALLVHQEAMLAGLSENDLAKIKGTQMEGYPKSIRDAIKKTEQEIAKLFEKRSNTEEDFKELLAHLKEAERRRSIGRKLDVAA